MKALRSLLFACLLPISIMAQFESGEKVRITQDYNDDMYVAGGEVNVEAIVSGDLVVTGGQVSVSDSIVMDLTLAGGQIDITGAVGDDIRAAGGQIFIDGPVADDAIVFGGDIEIGPNAIISGDLVVFGGEIEMNGSVLGAVRISGGDVNINGTVKGESRLSSGSLDIGEEAQFYSDVVYWSEDGDIDFGTSMKSGSTQFDESLGWEANDYGDPAVGIAFGIFFAILFIIGGFLIIMLLNWAFGGWFERAATEVRSDWVKSLGSGLLYIIGLPVLIILGIMIVIGIPLSLFLFFFYIFSLVFGMFVVALIATYFLKTRGNKDWGYWKVVLIAFLITIAFQILTSIPFLGAVISFAIITIAYGAIGLALRKNRTEPGPIVHS
ncbi:MAG: hypothetical protein HKN45_03705 [Flavobacteriales bacterium]|nr:hypothetical protein [Flavobacteriales bacterium]